MPFGCTQFDGEVARLIRHAFPEKGMALLDIGPGSGKVAGLLSDYPNRYAVEIHEPYIARFGLTSKYAGVLHADARELTRTFLYDYKLVTAFDVLEHFTAAQAQEFIARVDDAFCALVVGVPYLYEQGEEFGNAHEAHLQPDLTPDVMRERFPGLERILGSDGYGVYANAAFMERIRGAGVRIDTETRVYLNPEQFTGVRLAICTPNPGSVTTRYLMSMIETAGMLAQFEIPFRIFLKTGACLDRVRNLMVKDVLDSSIGFTHLLWIDSDQGWEPSYVLRLLYHRKPLVGIASIKKIEEPGFALSLFDANRVQYEDGLIEAAGVGTGFCLVERDVFLRLIQAHPELEIKDSPDEHHGSKHHYALYQTALDRGLYIGEDLTFCNRYRAIGGQIFVDPHCDLIHVGTREFRGSLATHMTAQENA